MRAALRRMVPPALALALASTAGAAALTEAEVAKWDRHIKANLHRGLEQPAVAARRPKEPQPAYLFTDWWQGPEREVDAEIAGAAPVGVLSDPCYWSHDECAVPELRAEFTLEEQLLARRSEKISVPCLTTLEGCSLEDQAGLPRGELESVARDPPCWWDEEAVAVA